MMRDRKEVAMTLNVWARDTTERVLATIIQSAILFVLSAPALDGSLWGALLAAVVPGAFNVIKAAFEAWMPAPKTWLGDTAVRTVWTFIIVFAGALTAGAVDLLAASTWESAALAAGAAALAVVKAAIAARYLANEASRLTPASFARAA